MKSIAEKKISGTYEPCKEKNPMAFEPLTTVPPVPAGLTGEAATYWQDVTRVLVEAETLTKADLPAILRASQLFAIHQKAVRDVETYGATQTQNGYTSKSGYWLVLTDAERNLAAFEKQFGLTIYGRSKIPANDKPKPDNPFLKLMQEAENDY